MILVGLDDNYIPFTRDEIFFPCFEKKIFMFENSLSMLEARVPAALNSSTSSEVIVTLKVLRFIVRYSILLHDLVTFTTNVLFSFFIVFLI